MADLSLDVVIGQVINVLDETFIYRKKPWTYFTDSKPDAGFIGLLQGLNAADVSRPIAGTSIVSHVHHVIFSLLESTAWIRGDHSHKDWKESWRVSSVTDSEWAEMLDHLRASFLALRIAIRENGAKDILTIGGTIGVVAHMAFHLGAIRQKVALLRQ
ncbi:hypothetical protein L0244_29735 [bacterium]|nr:hypothetical protein [bacterium]